MLSIHNNMNNKSINQSNNNTENSFPISIVFVLHYVKKKHKFPLKIYFFVFQLECCGINSSNDWIIDHATVPASCGSNPPALKGCMTMLVEKVENFSVYVGVAGFVIGAIELVGICFACCLANGVKS